MKYILSILISLTSILCYGQSSIFTTQIPSIQGVTDNKPIECGLQFTTTTAATVTALRFYKTKNDLAVYTLKLYSGSSLLTSATFQGAATGWVIVPLQQTVQIYSGYVYTVAYLSAGGYYQASNPFTFPIISGSVTAIKGVYKYATDNVVPTAVYQTCNYFADIIFQSQSIQQGKDTVRIRDTVWGTRYLDTLRIRDTVRRIDTLILRCPDTTWIYSNGIDSLLPLWNNHAEYIISMPSNIQVKFIKQITTFWRRFELQSDGTWLEK
jgi:Domain of unknown function (DUF4082)